ncbi:MAG: LPS assembly lipoprotein LptE [Sedimentisphaerales bacterium]
MKKESPLNTMSDVRCQMSDVRCQKSEVIHSLSSVLCLLSSVLCLLSCGCTEISGYSNESLFPQQVSSVCLEMFDNQSFRRGVEYELSDALAKRIEAETPYKIISSPDRADSIISGQIVSIDESVLSIEREVGRALEKEVQLAATVSWKNLKTGELLIDNQSVSARATFSEFQMQDFSYASALAANNLAQKIVELMQRKW